MLSVGPAAAAASAVRTGLKAISADNGTAFRIVRRLTKREPGFSVSSPGGRAAGRPERARTCTPATTRRGSSGLLPGDFVKTGPPLLPVSLDLELCRPRQST